MVRRSALSLVFFALVFCLSNQASAVLPCEVAAGAAAAQAAPRVVSTAAKGLAAIPSAIVQTLNLPLGLLETALFPLPGPTLAGGIARTAKGLMGPVNLVGSVLKLPFSLLRSLGGG